MEYKYPNSDEVERRFKVLALWYLQGRFILDFITMLPLYRIFADITDYARLFYLIRVTRLYRGLELLNTQSLMKKVKSMVNKRINHIIGNDQYAAIDKIKDQNYISVIVVFSYSIRIFKLLVILISMSYFTGLFWYIFAEIQLDRDNSRAMFSDEEQ